MPKPERLGFLRDDINMVQWMLIALKMLNRASAQSEESDIFSHAE